ncbi:MAG: nitroreductase family protein [Candidatus Krumholzibacteriota bacterium]|nr:nitroreductase family protein [Candidatus Krumholzibacteriota bacterium]
MSIDIILARRSIRKFKEREIEEEKLTKIVEAGMAAPSSRNRKPWHLVTVTERETLNRLAEGHPYGKMLFEATAAIAVCGDTGISPDYWVQDCSAVTENILIAAASLDLGSCWLGCHPREERVSAIKKILSIPENIGVLSLIAIGYPAEEKEARTQYDKSRDHRQSW